METGRRAILVLVLLIAAIVCGSHAQTICNVPYAGLMACKPAATPPNPPPPTAACCTALSHANMGCLCSYKNSKLLPSLGVDPNLAMQLPDKCHLPHPARC
ncbi:putative lipid-transfer protein DIR1 [Punica granatum]|uniref:Bifunctional inhibitor/plant lipid transfer protein/seed storage helical domain-containing protein n=2 Tax=Punica granatum TaxID=22663 RepID=A0A218XSG3_PUNGR|nr:putative lipid-transfer protein DIR1 [Punica granatum]OWM87977.1 hypothetical protein CDL15_Pgr000394 [Punica granatum]PKI49022.1 hypothetical protein CRG98_030609 [Punica granatum]